MLLHCVPLVYLVMATLPSLPVALVVLAVVGLAAGPINPLLFTVTDRDRPGEPARTRLRRGAGGAWAAIPLGILLGGLLVESDRRVGDLPRDRRARTRPSSRYGFFNPAFREMDRAR